MTDNEIAIKLGEEQACKIKDLVHNADYSKCEISTVRKEVDTFIVDCLFLLVKQRNGITQDNFWASFARHSPWAATLGFGLYLYAKISGVL